MRKRFPIYWTLWCYFQMPQGTQVKFCYVSPETFFKWKRWSTWTNMNESIHNAQYGSCSPALQVQQPISFLIEASLHLIKQLNALWFKKPIPSLLLNICISWTSLGMVEWFELRILLLSDVIAWTEFWQALLEIFVSPFKQMKMYLHGWKQLPEALRKWPLSELALKGLWHHHLESSRFSTFLLPPFILYTE